MPSENISGNESSKQNSIEAEGLPEVIGGVYIHSLKEPDGLPNSYLERERINHLIEEKLKQPDLREQLDNLLNS